MPRGYEMLLDLLGVGPAHLEYLGFWFDGLSLGLSRLGSDTPHVFSIILSGDPSILTGIKHKSAKKYHITCIDLC